VTESKKKLVLSFKPESQQYKPAGHNLTAEQTYEIVRKLESGGSRALVLDQEEQHRALTFHRCKGCKEAVERAVQSAAQSRVPQKQQEELASAAAADESESE